jgi:Tetracyclin repressor-like, C-terminal domain
MAQKPELARAVRESFLTGRRVALAAVLKRGVERGDLRPTWTSSSRSTCWGGPPFYRLLITGGPLDEQLAEGAADLIVCGFARETPSRAKSTRKEQAQ